MPKVNIRKLSPLQRRIFNTVILVILVILIVTSVINYFGLSRAIRKQYDTEALETSALTADFLDSGMVIELRDAVMAEYRARGVKSAEEARSSPILSTEAYLSVVKTMGTILKRLDITYLTLMVADLETSHFVYLADGDDFEKNAGHISYPGETVPMTSDELECFAGTPPVIPPYRSVHDMEDASNRLNCACAAVTDAEGRTVAYVIADVSMAAIRSEIWRHTAWVVVFLLILTVAIAVFCAWLGRRYLVEPLADLSDAAEHFFAYKLSHKNEKTAFFDDLDVTRGGREVYLLSQSLVTMEDSLNEYMDNLVAVTKDRARIRTELSVAKHIQEDMLPTVFPPFPERTDMDIYASMAPAREVGGDFYDLFLLDRDRLALVVADVSGKGVPAALFMMISKTLLNNEARKNGASPAAVLAEVNDRLCENNKEEMFVTAWMAVVDLKTGRMTYANAGHEDPIIRSGGKWEFHRTRHGLALAAMEGMTYQDHTVQLQPGDMVFQYTDGVTEATDPDNQLFGADRLLEALNATEGEDTRRILESVRKKVDVFVKEADQFDDITMLCFELKRGDEAGRPTENGGKEEKEEKEGGADNA